MIRILSAAVFASVLTLITLGFLYKNKTSKGRKALAYTACAILLFVVEVWLPAAIPVILFGCAVAYGIFFMRMKVPAALFVSASFAAVFFVSRVLTILLFKGIFGDNTSSVMLTVMSYIISLSLYLTAVYVISRFFNHEQEHKTVSLALLALPLATGAAAFCFAYINEQYPLSDVVRYGCAACCCVLLLSDIAAFYIHERAVRLYCEVDEIRKENLRLQNREDYYAALEKQSEDAHVLMHDISRHLNTIGYISEKSENVTTYLNDINDDFGVSNPVDYCGNPTLNLIVHRFYERCRSNEIRFDVNIREAQIDFITAPDITALFDNLLENAYEAAALSKDKYIELSLYLRNTSFIIIRVLNSCDLAPTIESGELATRKTTPLHGIGTKSICRVIKKYDGDLKWQYHEVERVFEITIMMKKI